MKRTSRKTASLSESLQRHLNSYALAASATGVGVLAVAQSAEAKIVYTPAHQRLYVGYHLDLNHDGIPDFIINWNPNGFSSLFVLPSRKEPNNMVIGGPIYSNKSHRQFGSYGASALSLGVSVGQSAKFQPRHSEMFIRFRSCTSDGGSCTLGQWHKAENKYLGLMFHIRGEGHYGWARITYVDHCGEKGRLCYRITGYAYETIANKPIITGKTKRPDVITLQPGSLGALAAGVSRSHSGK